MKHLKVFLLTLVLFGFSISPNWAQSNNPILTIGCLSDLHCGEASGSSSSSGTLATSVTTTVQQLKQTENLDAIFVGGDIVSGNSISQDQWNACRTNTINALLSAFQKSTTSTALTGAKTATPLYIVTGNHEFQSCGNRGSYNSADYYNTVSGNKYGMQYYTNDLKSTTTSTVTANPKEAYYETLSGVTDSNGKNHVACYHYQLNGIDIIGINTSVETYNSAISTLFVKLQYDLRILLKADSSLNAYDLIKMARDRKMIDQKEADILHKFRLCRDAIQHPDKKQIKYTEDDLAVFTEVTFRLKGEKK